MFFKRFFDLFFSLVFLILIMPLFFVIAVCIKVDSKGPVFFSQPRVGRGGKIFNIFKFRTMVIGAELLGPQITASEDNRITRLGKYLRKYKLDELPQLINVCFGNMSFVGPRPEVPKYFNTFPEHIKDIVKSIRPGITDRASIEFYNENEILKNAIDVEAVYINDILPIKFRYYQKYLNDRNSIGDLKIIWDTLRIVFSRISKI